MTMDELTVRRKVPREFPRIPVKFPVRVTATDISGMIVRSLGAIVNLSRGGAALELNFEAAPDQPLTIHWQDRNGVQTMSALLRWKQPCSRKWCIGIEITGDSKVWSSLIYTACKSRT